jgi:hypothetical protein
MELNDDSLKLDGYSYIAGMYHPFGNVISFPFYNLQSIWGSKLRYGLTKAEFSRNAKLIDRLLAYHHEHTHLYQSMGTLNGYFLYECLLVSATVIFTLCEKVKYALPLTQFMSSGQPGQKLPAEYSDNFIRGFYYKFLIDWNQGSHQHYPVPVQLKPNTILSFVERTVPFVNDTADKLLGVGPKPIPQVFVSSNKEAYTMFLGSFSIMEAFAKSVELEHLIWFNKSVCETYTNSLTSDPGNLVYTMPLLLYYNLIPAEYYQAMSFDFAVFRVICDIALMNQDSLLYDYDTDYTLRLDDEPNLAIRTHPGCTFIRALKALPHVPPLKNHNEDVLRMYDNLCEEIGIPAHDEMAERGVRAIGNRLNRFTNDWPGKLFENYLKVMRLRKEYPLFFINDLIFADKAEDMFNNFKDFVFYVDTGGRLHAAQQSNPNVPFVAMLADVLYQLLQDKTVSCNYERMFGACRTKGQHCVNTFPGASPLSPKNCIYFNLIKPIYGNAIPSD